MKSTNDTPETDAVWSAYCIDPHSESGDPWWLASKLERERDDARRLAKQYLDAYSNEFATDVTLPWENCSTFRIGQYVRYKGYRWLVCYVDEGHGILALDGDRYIAPNHDYNRCTEAPMSECEILDEIAREETL